MNIFVKKYTLSPKKERMKAGLAFSTSLSCSNPRSNTRNSFISFSFYLNSYLFLFPILYVAPFLFFSLSFNQQKTPNLLYCLLRYVQTNFLSLFSLLFCLIFFASLFLSFFIFLSPAFV